VHVTPQRNEFGIDFLAIVPAYSNSKVFVSGSRGVRIVGQSKKYNSPVNRGELQKFNDTLNSVRNNKAELLDIIPPWFRGSATPIMSCFVAHAGFQSGGRDIGRQNGHILLDTLELAEIIYQPKSHSFLQMDTEIEKTLWLGLSSISNVG
jgi:hypothetical protein